ncbi:aminotransferase class III-fold pyridoxal phosphate-dependent enzyme [Aestuariicella hydrocarbonica]|uniref:Aminotransferase class III-fold pyridoxal phosphate-dependent enzyme n=1 Tax=Pseudomaricurvus hydrocarbonicus TaxID=1470433 RepID=A0A9E5JV02_9GAMM|nr:aminotransferase [Aestuariicella hydrocarbonica]NHO65066.1 aminotransferase class III-fold pyridoxal phosphate-dependent enzyme [Aestuariicella hydrocarbonica]
MSPAHPTSYWQDLDKAHHLHPFTDFQQYRKTGGRIFNKAEHIYIYDTDGNEILDGMSGLWCCNLGYSQPEITNAISEQLQQLPFYNNFFNCSNQPAVELANALVDVTPKQFNQVFFTNSGSEANDTNIKLVHRYYDLIGKPEKKLFISRNNAYHGSTVAAGSLGGMSGMHKQYTGLNYVHHIQQPHWFAEGAGQDKESFGLQAARELERKIDELGEENVAAFIAEPVQGAGGVIVPPASYWPEIQRICRERDILLISDEVICGFGRTGNWFGCETFGFEPDLMTFAKAVTNGFQPLGGVMVGNKVADVLTAGGGEFAHGLTYSGHPAACAAGIATLKVLRDNQIIETAAQDVMPYFQAQLQTLVDHPIVGEVRGQGMFAALELVKDKSSHERLAPDSAGAIHCRDKAIQNGLMVRAVGDAIVTAPPIICNRRDVDTLIDRLSRALDTTAAHFNIR